ncbi:uncharacterized protein LOC113522940 [Galleria mellonella]|uniref:Uncharacterized protein LOC113522940 n=1 Tax=Galleria mellonella TaxID=7137 RepID=A0ABM3N289_GALME|nr:uncharacterized protein LOC113522940 [Galleria mellonella]
MSIPLSIRVGPVILTTQSSHSFSSLPYLDLGTNMSLLYRLITGFAVITITSAAPKSPDKLPNCQEFTNGLTFNDSQAIGTWHLLHYSTEKSNGSGESHCIQIVPVTENERKDLSNLIGKYVENLKWEKLTLKMQIPCADVKSNRTRDYYLERLEGDGSYRTLQMPPSTAKLDLADFHRYPMRLKIVENMYLGMMDCHEKFVFLLGPQPPKGKPIDDRLKKMIEIYWPEEN